jgi:hypothetical protein
MIKRLTDPDPAREAEYVKLKIQTYSPPFVLRLASALENLLDKYMRPRSVESLDDILNCADQLMDVSIVGKEIAVIGWTCSFHYP